MRLPRVQLQTGRERRVRSGHPWVYSNEIAMTAEVKALPPGTPVALIVASGEPLGTAFFNPRPLVSARLLTTTMDQPFDVDFLSSRLIRAKSLREQLYPGPFYRLIHAEADGLPGLVIDRYGPAVVVQLNTAGIDRLAEPLVEAIRAVLAPETIVLRRDSSARTLEGLERLEPEVIGTSGEILVEENGCKFPIDPVGGQKTGWFFDQRENRAAVAKLAKGRTVIDAFAHLGGFGIQAVAAGAASAVLLDSSAPSLEKAKRAADLNGVADRIETIVGDAVATLEKMRNDGRRFGVVVVDPPAYVKSKKDLTVGLRAYRKLAREAAGLVEPGGFLFAASCSHNVEPTAFAEQVAGGLSAAKRPGRILMSVGAAPDHPVHPLLPESAYLKGILAQLD